MTMRNAKNVQLYSIWGILTAYSLFRYQPWRVFDSKYCSVDNLATLAKAALKPDNWLFIAVTILTIVIAIRLYAWAENRWLWFSHYGRIATICLTFIILLLISKGCE